MRTNEGPVRSVVWAPAAFDDGGDALAGRSVFMTAGHDGNVSIWDARCDCETRLPGRGPDATPSRGAHTTATACSVSDRLAEAATLTGCQNREGQTMQAWPACRLLDRACCVAERKWELTLPCW